MDEMYSDEYFRKIHRENIYIITQSLFALSMEFNIPDEARELCLKTVDDLYKMIGDEDIIIKVNMDNF